MQFVQTKLTPKYENDSSALRTCSPHQRLAPLRKRNLENQNLVIKIICRSILILHLTKIDVPVLRDKIVIRECEEIILIISLSLEQNHTFPFFIKETSILGSAVVDAETVELGVDVEVDEAAVFCWCDVGVEDTGW